MDSGKPAYSSDQVRILVILSLMMVLSTAIFFLRLLARRISVTKYWYDDYMVFVALVLSYITISCVLGAVPCGLGRRGAAPVSTQDVSHVTQLAYLAHIFWQLTMPAVKTSLLLFYIRIFPTRRMRIVSYITGGLMWSFCIATTVVSIDTCTPIRAFWDTSVHGSCINKSVFYLVESSVQLITDIMVFVIPLPAVWNLHISSTKKIGLSVIFLLGGVVCVATTMRIILSNHLIPAKIDDITRLAVDIAIWTGIEASLGVICACIPCLTPLVVRIMRIRKPHLPQGSSEAINRDHNRAPLGGDGGFHRMHEFSELGATFEMTIHGGSYTDCRASEYVPDSDLPPYGINVKKEVKQSVFSRDI